MICGALCVQGDPSAGEIQCAPTCCICPSGKVSLWAAIASSSDANTDSAAAGLPPPRCSAASARLASMYLVNRQKPNSHEQAQGDQQYGKTILPAARSASRPAWAGGCLKMKNTLKPNETQRTRLQDSRHPRFSVAVLMTVHIRHQAQQRPSPAMLDALKQGRHTNPGLAPKP